MKIIKKIAAIMLSVMMVLGMCSVVGAEETSGTSEADTGKITIDNAIVGQTYTIYRILELESFSDKTTKPNTGNYAYKAVKEWEDFITKGEGEEYLKIEDGYVYWKGDNNDARAAELAKKALVYANKNKIKQSKEPVEAKSAKVEFTDLPLGYYLVDSSTGALCSLNTTDKDVTIEEKNAAPTVKKKVQEDSKINTEDEYGESNTADLGQTVNFQTTITAQPGAQNYVLHDRMSEGLTFDKIDSVKVGDTPLAVNKDYVTESESTGDGCTFHITFTPTYCESIKTETIITVTYSATLNKGATIAGDGNKNETWLKYGENSQTTHETTTTKTYEIPVFKYTKKGADKKALEGAEFELYRDEKCTSENQIKFIKTGTNNTSKYDCYRIAIDSETSSVGKITTSADGKFKISGLDADTYYLKEVTAPKGYNKLASPLKIEITSDGKIKVNNGDEKEATNPVEVENNTGSILPSTGGMGTTLFYIFGAILVIGSGVVLITKKRMK